MISAMCVRGKLKKIKVFVLTGDILKGNTNDKRNVRNVQKEFCNLYGKAL